MRDNGIRPSTGSVDSLWDNAPTEYHKVGSVYAKTYRDREQAALKIFEYTHEHRHML